MVSCSRWEKAGEQGRAKQRARLGPFALLSSGADALAGTQTRGVTGRRGRWQQQKASEVPDNSGQEKGGR